jgi:predicted AlkP superfamily pyrophosphatase or phosphodiesterase
MEEDMKRKKISQKKVLSRRRFLEQTGKIVGLIALGSFMESEQVVRGFPAVLRKQEKPKKLIYIAIDALHPAYLSLDSKGNAGGAPGNFLMPNIRAFLERSLWYPNALTHLPAATDMNHLNAMSGTFTAQTGIVGVWAQPVSWDGDNAIIQRSSLSFARDDKGRPVDTIFHAWKRRWPESKTLLISGKEWVAEMFKVDDGRPAVDFLITGKEYPSYVSSPQKESFADPLTDADAACDPESGRKGFFDFAGMRWGNITDHMRPSQVMTRLYTGQRSLLTVQMEHFPERFPHDSWIVDSTLKLFQRENPDLAYILLAQCDDGGHCIGTAHDPSEFVPGDPSIIDAGCASRDQLLVSARNRMLVREAVLDCMRDVDLQFGKLLRGLEEQGILRDSRIILLSDHSAINHLATEEFISTDVMGILEKAGINTKGVYTFSVSSYGVVYWRERKTEVAKAREVLFAHRAVNPQTGVSECPWWILDRNDMQNGVPGICLPGELYHRYYIDADHAHTMIWPDLVVLAKNGWQIPVYNGHIPNVGINVPCWTPPWRVYNGGHGSVDTLPIIAAVSIPGGRCGTSRRVIRISDLGATAISLAGLTLTSTVIGKDLSGDLR